MKATKCTENECRALVSNLLLSCRKYMSIEDQPVDWCLEQTFYEK